MRSRTRFGCGRYSASSLATLMRQFSKCNIGQREIQRLNSDKAQIGRMSIERLEDPTYRNALLAACLTSGQSNPTGGFGSNVVDPISMHRRAHSSIDASEHVSQMQLLANTAYGSSTFLCILPPLSWPTESNEAAMFSGISVCGFVGSRRSLWFWLGLV